MLTVIPEVLDAVSLEHRRGGLVGEEPGRSSQTLEHMIAQRTKIPDRSPDPIS